MIRALFLTLFAALSFGQTASPDVDRALRARITAFYDLLVNHQFRRAEEFIAPDSRDIYYEREKPRYMSFVLSSIVYSENFTRADVVVTLKMPVTEAMLPVPMDLPAASTWRLLDGAWYWIIPKVSVTDLLKTMNGGEPATPDAKAVAVPLPMPGNMSFTPQLPSNANLPGGMGRPESMPQMGAGEVAQAPQFSMDRSSVTLTGRSAEKVTITNTSSSPMTLFLLGKVPNVEAAFDQPAIKPGEKAVLSIQAAEGAKSGVLVIGVTETRGMTTLPVTVKEK